MRSSTAADLLRRYSTQKLEAEIATLRQIAEDKKQLRDAAIKEYAVATNDLLLGEQLLALKRASELRASIPPTETNGATQTAIVLNLIRTSPPPGFRPREIAKLLDHQGITIKPPYLHTILMRLKKRGEIKAERGVYIPIT